MLFDSINQAFTVPVVTAAPGGAGGGGATRTPFGTEGLERYNRILDRSARNAVDDVAPRASGRAFARTTSAEILKLMLGIILIAAAFKAFWRHGWRLSY